MDSDSADSAVLAVIGIDIARCKFDVAVRAKGHAGAFKFKILANTPAGFAVLTALLAAQGITRVHAVMEATGSDGEALAVWLSDTGHRVSIINPAQIKGFGQSLMVRNKTDKVDSRVIALFGEAHRPDAWQPPALEVRQLQAWVRRLIALQDLKQQEENRLPTANTVVKPSIESIVAVLTKEIEAVKQRIRDHFDQHPGLKAQADLLDSIPGIGENTIASLLAFMGEVSRFTHAKQLAAFAGLTPRQCQSGSSVRGATHLTKAGNPLLRRALYMPALVAMRHNPLIKTFYLRLRANGKPAKSALAACMRKLLHIVFGVLKSQKPFNPNHRLAA